MSTTYFFRTSDPPRMIGSESDAIFIWSMPARNALHIVREYDDESIVTDSMGHAYTGNGFWDLAGHWDWVGKEGK